MVYDSAIDIGTCVTSFNGSRYRLYCLDNNDKNYCCRLSNSTSLLHDLGNRACCSHEEYSDQYWVTLAAIQGSSILLSLLFIYLLVVIGWFYMTSFSIQEATVKESRRQIIKHLLRQQILHKSKRSEPSVISSLRNISQSLSSSRRKRRELEWSKRGKS